MATYSDVLFNPKDQAALDLHLRNPYQFRNFGEFLGGWMQTPLISRLNFGYRPVALFAIICSLPPRLFVGIKRSLMSVHEKIESLALNSEKYAEMAGWKANDKMSKCEIDLTPAFLEEETNHGLIKIELGTNDQRYKNVTINSRIARLWGMRKAELLRRIQLCDVPLPFSELDWLRSFVVDIENSFQDRTSQYLRMIIGVGLEARGILVCQTTIRVFNSVCRMSQVLRRTHRRRRKPSLASPPPSFPSCPYAVHAMVSLGCHYLQQLC